MNCILAGLIGGIDEAGRGPLAGPVVSSCVVWQALPHNRTGINDSKLLSPRGRLNAFSWIARHAFRIGIGIASHDEIDNLNIHRASLLSMRRALMDTGVEPRLVLVDGRHAIDGAAEAKAVTGGDRKCFFIAAASIVAKVVRDHIMDCYHELYPRYGFDKNRGYPTDRHRSAIKDFGITPIHRRTFRGVKEGP